MLLPTAITGGLLTLPVYAETELAHPMPTRQAFKLDPESGCFLYSGIAAEFVGKFKRGAYVTVTMDVPERIPVMDAPGFEAPGSLIWFGPLPASRDYTIGYGPAMLFGAPAKVIICGTTSPPDSVEAAVKADTAIIRMLDAMEDPRAVTEGPTADGRQADICGFRVRDVTIRDGAGADASPLQPRVAGSIRHYANLNESPFDLFAVCTPEDPAVRPRTAKLPRETKDCYFAGGKFECSYLADSELVPVE